MTQKTKEPEDLGIKFGSEDEKFWTEIKEKLKKDNRTMEKQIAINNHVIPFLQTKINKEKEKFK